MPMPLLEQREEIKQRDIYSRYALMLSIIFLSYAIKHSHLCFKGVFKLLLLPLVLLHLQEQHHLLLPPYVW